MIHKEVITYEIENEPYEGVLYHNASLSGEIPGVLVFHNFMGLSDFDEEKAKQLAEIGYAAFCVDMYGVNHRPSSKEEADSCLIKLNTDRKLLLKRALIAFNLLKDFSMVDSSRTGAIGFCLGGKCVLDLARSGEDINGVVSFHGVYDSPGVLNSTKMKSSVLVLHGWEDPLATPDQMKGLANELTECGADWVIQAYGDTGHAFTNPKASDKNSKFFFNPKSNDRSWLSMKSFLNEIFTD